MSNSILEAVLTNDGPIVNKENVVFNKKLRNPTGIEYDNTTGVIKFKENGQYSIKWWVATETTLKKAIEFQLESKTGGITPGIVTPGCSPIKTGQVTGFGVIDIEVPDTTLSLVCKTATNIMISRKMETKGHLLVTPIGAPSLRVYRADLSAPGSLIEVPLGNGIIYRLLNYTPTLLRLNLASIDLPVRYDYRRFCSFNGTTGTQGDFTDNLTLNGVVIKDGDIYNNSQEMHWVLIRVQNPVSELWSTYEVRFFASGGLSRVTVWVNVIEEEVSY